MSARVAVVGAGANGAPIAADAARAGFHVTVIEQWPAHVEAMKAQGVLVRYPEASERTPLRVVHLCEVAELCEQFDVVLLCVKAYDTRWAAELARPLLAPEGVMVGLQNGMTYEAIADVVGPERAVGAVIEVSSNMWEPGVCNRETVRERAWFAVGAPHPDAAAGAELAARVLESTGTVERSDDIISSKWMKLVLNAAELVPSAILDLALADAVEAPGMREVMVACGAEAIRACLASGSKVRPVIGLRDLPGGPAEQSAALLDQVLRHFTSRSTLTTCLQDWRKGRRNEVHEINGLVVDILGASQAPANTRVVELAEAIERGDARPGLEHLERLVEAVREP